MHALKQIIVGTPWWVWVLLVLLIQLGLKASKTRVVSIKRMALLPAIFAYMSIHTLLTSFRLDIFAITIWTCAIIIGTILGLVWAMRSKLKVDRSNHLLELPGSWSILILILVVFGAKYYFAFALDADPLLVSNTDFEFVMLSVSGVVSGLFVGKFSGYIYRLFHNTSVNLK